MRKSLRAWIGKAVFQLALPCTTVSSVVTAWLRNFRIQMYVLRRGEVIGRFAEPAIEVQPRAKVCIAVVHVVREEEASDADLAAPMIERMRHTVDGILISFADYELTILVSSLPNRSIIHFLPDYQRARLELIEGPECEPMFVEFRVQDELIARINDYDWFLFIEDDLVIHDATFLRKLQKFHQHAGPRDLLMPHRYEYSDGVKRYIDLNIASNLSWSKLSALTIDGAKFSEFSNPHAAFYCLSRDQLRHWDRSGRTWKNRVVMVGPLESAATYCLLECFNLYKPHPSNMPYLEVRHWGKKYSQLCPRLESPFTLDPSRQSEAQVPPRQVHQP